MILELENVSRKRDGRWVLKDISWRVEKGDHWVLYGLNGSGKTSLLELINAYLFPTEGTIRVLGMEFGKTYLAERLRSRIGFVSSSIGQKIRPDDNAYEVVLSGAFASIGLFEDTDAETDQKGVEILRELGCLDYANRNFHTLSQGERQRILIGRALMADPELLILDEPTNGLDFIAREELLESVARIARRPDGPAILYVTHHAEEILPEFNKTLLLKDGRVFGSGNTADLINSECLSGFFGLSVEADWQAGRPTLTKKRAEASPK
ncbi:ABC transporter ATP-binding protein [Bhargavaea ullalensis]|uniref:Iron complex transport system ATP-binding protein n=1 Tax=Bhargavaea ullalensis TaxID=1265685 RepID=A0ABV2GC88_9BACL